MTYLKRDLYPKYIKNLTTQLKNGQKIQMQFSSKHIQIAREKMVSIASHEGNAHQSHSEIPLHTLQDDCNQKDINKC